MTSPSVPLRAVADDPSLDVEVVPETLRPGALDRPVRWAHVSELRDPAPYLLGDELLLTAGVNLPPGEDVDRYVRGLRAAGVTALGFGVTPELHDELPGALRAACARHGLPLLVVGVRTPFLAISRAVSVALGEASRRAERRVTEAREALTRAAAGGSGELARGLATRLSGWVLLLGPGDEPVAGHGAPLPMPAEVRRLAGRLREGTGARAATTELPDGTFVLAQPVFPQATASQLLAVGRRDRFAGADRAIVAVGAALLGLTVRAGTGPGGLGSALTALLLGEAGTDVVGELLGPGEYRVLAGLARGRTAPGPDWLRARLGSPLVRGGRDRFTAVVRDPPDADVLAGLLAEGWLTVVGGPRPAGRLAGAPAELDVLLQRALATGAPVVAGDEPDLARAVNPAGAAEFAATLLAPLRERPEVLRTLRAWLAHHGGWDRTAAALGVHRNSVRHRIGQARRLLGVDLDDPDVRMRLWFALRWSGPSGEQVTPS